MTDPDPSRDGHLPILNIDGPLPWGRLAIEASAGTGKTYALCHLAVRYISEADIPASGFLIVTFTRAATAELRDRIRKAIRNRISELQNGDAGLAPDTADEYLKRLQKALTEFDTITITTIHSFATQTISSLGATAQYEPPRRFAQDDDNTIRSACSDVIMRAVARGLDPELKPTVTELSKVVDTALRGADIMIEPSEPEEEPDATHVLAALGREVVTMLRLRRLTRGEVSFDDVLTGLRDSIRSDAGATVVESLRNRYQVVMIDEFQDTDPVQWAIFEAAFANNDTADRNIDQRPSVLITVGDPKQSIYSFRGADISTYSAATQAPRTTRVALGTNWRSDGKLLEGLEVLLSGTTYGDGIGFVPVRAKEENQARYALDNGEPITPVQVRLVLGDDLERSTGGRWKGYPKASVAQEALWNDLVHVIHHTLNEVRIPDTNGGHRATRPEDIAVLVHGAWQAEIIQKKLIETGVPAVLSRAGKVLESPAAEQWRWLLDALARPADTTRIRRLALSWFTSAGAEALDAGDDAALIPLLNQSRSWLEVLRSSGVTSFVHSVLEDSGVIARLLREPDGDRSVTDLLHVGELLQTNSAEERCTVTSLLNLIQPGDEQAAIDDGDEYARRIETQDSAVKIMTIWVSKGLEFPVVMAPTLFTDREKMPQVVVPGEAGGRIFDLAYKESSRKNEAILLTLQERLRLLYVALTRASHQVVTWWATSNNSAKSALSHVLFARDEAGLIDADTYRNETVAIPLNEGAADKYLALAANSGGLLGMEIIGHVRPAGQWTGSVARERTNDPQSPHLAAAELERLPNRRASRWSFSVITSGTAHHAQTTMTPDDDTGASDEHEPSENPTETIADGIDAQDTSTMPLSWLPANPAFGNFVHKIYEQIDFAAADVEAQIRTVIEEQRLWRSVNLTPPRPKQATAERPTDAQGVELLVAGILQTLTTPLRGEFGDRSLSSLHRADRLSELSFELLLGVDSAGDDPPTERDIGRLITSHLNDDDPLIPWAGQLEQGCFGVDLGGHLTGSIDALFRVNDGDHDRFIVVDYKTNKLSPRETPPDPSHYTPSQMTEAMVHNHYPLQALLYSVAVHRYLRSRIMSYDPALHLGGVAYLFLRGMVGTDSPTFDGHTSGVWSWKPPVALITDLSDLLAGVNSGTRRAS